MSKRLMAATTVSGITILSVAGTSLAAHTNAGANATSRVPDVTVLFGRAVRTVERTRRPTFAHVVVLEADGITRGGRCTLVDGCSGGRGTTSAAGFLSWRFVFANLTSGSRFKTVTVTYGPPPKAFGPVRGFVGSFEEDVDIPRVPQLTLAEAVTLLRRAGQRGQFFNVTLRNPLGPRRSNPLYIFGFAGNHFFAVDTVTKRVRPFS